MYSKVYPPPSNGCRWSNFFKAPAFSPVCKPHGAFTNVVYIGFTQRKKGQEKKLRLAFFLIKDAFLLFFGAGVGGPFFYYYVVSCRKAPFKLVLLVVTAETGGGESPFGWSIDKTGPPFLLLGPECRLFKSLIIQPIHCYNKRIGCGHFATYIPP